MVFNFSARLSVNGFGVADRVDQEGKTHARELLGQSTVPCEDKKCAFFSLFTTAILGKRI